MRAAALLRHAPSARQLSQLYAILIHIMQLGYQLPCFSVWKPILGGMRCQPAGQWKSSAD